jgi:hypothetical protein
MLFLRQWMSYHNLNPELCSQIVGYIEYQWELKLLQKIDSKELMVLLNQNLKE